MVTGEYYFPYTERKFVDSVDSVSYIRGSCKWMFTISYLVYSVNYSYMFTNNILCLQYKLPCVFTNHNKDQSEWRI